MLMKFHIARKSATESRSITREWVLIVFVIKNKRFELHITRVGREADEYRTSAEKCAGGCTSRRAALVRA
ncbi:hypothetical protein DMN77_15380 [Paenibacillus sp. 79R4]|nr:hypothetical protein [Paenibacillus sp. 79R4]